MNDRAMKRLVEGQSITDAQAAEFFSAEVLRVGGGWGFAPSELIWGVTGSPVKIYGHSGSHRDGTKGWKIHSFGGLR